jgi:hypothetical protein
VNVSTFLRSGLTVNMPGSVDVVGNPVLANPTKARWFNTCTLTVAGVRQNCASDSEQPAFRIRPENALDTTGDRLEDVYRSDPWILDMSIFKNIRLPAPAARQVSLFEQQHLRYSASSCLTCFSPLPPSPRQELRLPRQRSFARRCDSRFLERTPARFSVRCRGASVHGGSHCETPLVPAPPSYTTFAR